MNTDRQKKASKILTMYIFPIIIILFILTLCSSIFSFKFSREIYSDFSKWPRWISTFILFLTLTSMGWSIMLLLILTDIIGLQDKSFLTKDENIKLNIMNILCIINLLTIIGLWLPSLRTSRQEYRDGCIEYIQNNFTSQEMDKKVKYIKEYGFFKNPTTKKYDWDIVSQSE